MSATIILIMTSSSTRNTDPRGGRVAVMGLSLLDIAMRFADISGGRNVNILQRISAALSTFIGELTASGKFQFCPAVPRDNETKTTRDSDECRFEVVRNRRSLPACTGKVWNRAKSDAGRWFRHFGTGGNRRGKRAVGTADPEFQCPWQSRSGTSDRKQHENQRFASTFAFRSLHGSKPHMSRELRNRSTSRRPLPAR
jgi:hypothetical protein